MPHGHDWLVFEKDEFEDGKKALVEYWNRWLTKYMALYENERKLVVKGRAVPPKFAGLRINILISPKADGFRFVDIWGSLRYVKLIQCITNPGAYTKPTVGVIEETYAQTKADIGVFVYDDPDDFPISSKVLSETILPDRIIVENKDPERDAERRYGLKASTILPDLALLDSALKATNTEVKGKKLEELLRSIFGRIAGFVIAGSDVRTQDEEIDIVIENQSMNYPWNRESPLILVECKNWMKKKVGANEFKLFMNKIENRVGRAKLGFLIGTHSFTTTITTEMLRQSKEDMLIVPIDGKRLRELATETDKSGVLGKFYRIALLT